MKKEALIAIIVGSKSDLPLARECAETLVSFKIPHTTVVASAHRSPTFLEERIRELEKSVMVYIGVAGMAAHLPGVIASKTNKPVIGVPASSSILGLDALLSVSQMPPGVPVGCVAINGAKNAAILAAEIIALSDVGIRLNLEEALKKHRERMEREIVDANVDLNTES